MAVLRGQFCAFGCERLRPGSAAWESAWFAVGPLLADYAGSRMYAEGTTALTHDLKL
jgi:hypothetical protein